MCIGDTVTAWSILQKESLSLFYSIVVLHVFFCVIVCVIAYLLVVQDVDFGVDFDVIVVWLLFRRGFVAYRKVGRYEEKWRYFGTSREVA